MNKTKGMMEMLLEKLKIFKNFSVVPFRLQLAEMLSCNFILLSHPEILFKEY